MTITKQILVLNGPNLNLLGTREPNLYGNLAWDVIFGNLENLALEQNTKIYFEQSNAEHELINSIHNAKNNNINFILINAGAFTHSSIAIRDALLAVKIPFIEVHISNIYAREKFRHKSFLADIAVGVITGLGVDGYTYALMAAIKVI